MNLCVDFVGDTVDHGKRATWWQTITITLILGCIACLVLNCHEDLSTATSGNRGYRIRKWVNIVKWTCDRGCGALTNDEFCGVRAGKAGSWVKRTQDGRLWASYFFEPQISEQSSAPQRFPTQSRPSTQPSLHSSVPYLRLGGLLRKMSAARNKRALTSRAHSMAKRMVKRERGDKNWNQPNLSL